MTRSWIRSRTAVAAALLVLGALLMVSVGLSRDSARARTGADTVTSESLRRNIEDAGVQVRFAPVEIEGVQVLAGAVPTGRTEIGFEFQVFETVDQASIRGLGTLNAKDLGLIRPQGIYEVEANVRGILGNVAYATYRPVSRHETRSVQVHLANEKARLRVQRALDDALFGSFPADDPEAQPLPGAP